MDTSALKASSAKPSPFPPVNEVPLHKNPPLAPSQELAYRQKCIQLKRRLTEIEANNDATRKRIASERERIQKMRFLRAILLNQLRDVMSVPGKKLTPEQLSSLGIIDAADMEEQVTRVEGEGMLDDSSDESGDEDIPEPGERPTRTRRTNNNYRETVMNSNTTPSVTAAAYSQPGLPNIAPAGAYSPGAPRDGPAHASSFHVASTPIAAESPAYSQHGVPSQYPPDSHYPQHSSPIQQHQSLYSDPHRATAAAALPHEPGTNGVSSSAPPIRPDPPLVQFQNHMRPQLEADHYPIDQIDDRIEEEWKKLSEENRGLWEARYQEQMQEYQVEMDSYKQARRRGDYR